MYSLKLLELQPGASGWMHAVLFSGWSAVPYTEEHIAGNAAGVTADHLTLA